ncbi:hypothetical protein WGP40_01945 [Brachymonas sp. G13]|uniref:hypothetical protein n=1 Tax=Brachymonas TaxID=28219 RepID=UPI0016BBD45D|nr:hypothetical protein [Brachymonas sp. J145]MEE1654042.1 hypothetical protein [Brachymonas sp. J145]NLX16063.1 hypothetical protein [Ramlibacter sp.]
MQSTSSRSSRGRQLLLAAVVLVVFAVVAGIWLGRGASSDGSPVRGDGAAELTISGGAASAAALDASTQTEELTGRPPLQGQADPARQAEGAIVAPGGGVELQRHEDVQPLPPADAGADLPASAAEPMPDASEALPPLDDASAAQ